MPHPRKIVFNVPALVADGNPGRPGEVPVREEIPEPGDIRKLATLMEVSQALAGTAPAETTHP